jgi:broad specificity phosphatase PhoE
MAESAAVRMLLVRHGEVDANVEYRFLGRRDDSLNRVGLDQADQLAALFVNVPCTRVESSPLIRARLTAEAIALSAGVGLRIDDALIELDFGRWDGLTRKEIMELSAEDRRLLAQWSGDPGCAAPEGESLEDVQRRIVGLADRLVVQDAGATVALVSHMGPIKALLCAALGLQLTAARRLFLDPGTVSVVDWSVHPVVRLFNGHGHLGWTNARWLRTPPK